MNVDQVKKFKTENEEINSLLDRTLNELIEDLEVELTDHRAKDNAKHTINSIYELKDALVEANSDLIDELLKEKKAWYYQPFNILILGCIFVAIVLSILNLIIVLFS